MKRGEIYFPFEVKLTATETGLNKDSKALVQQIRALDRSRLDSAPKGLIPMARMQEVDAALRLHLAL
jgi:mRNA interferase MazF